MCDEVAAEQAEYDEERVLLLDAQSGVMKEIPAAPQQRDRFFNLSNNKKISSQCYEKAYLSINYNEMNSQTDSATSERKEEAHAEEK